jgi:hypothetical protein
MQSWPTVLPLPAAGSFNLALSDSQNLRVSGPAFARNRTNWQQTTATLQFSMSDVQFGIFQSWFHNRISGGASWFTMSVPWRRTATSTMTMRFNGSYQAQRASNGFWQVSAPAVVDGAAA